MLPFAPNYSWTWNITYKSLSQSSTSKICILTKIKFQNSTTYKIHGVINQIIGLKWDISVPHVISALIKSIHTYTTMANGNRSVQGVPRLAALEWALYHIQSQREQHCFNSSMFVCTENITIPLRYGFTSVWTSTRISMNQIPTNGKVQCGR